MRIVLNERKKNESKASSMLPEMDSIFVVAFYELCVRRPLAANRSSCGCETLE